MMVLVVSPLQSNSRVVLKRRFLPLRYRIVVPASQRVFLKNHKRHTAQEEQPAPASHPA